MTTAVEETLVLVKPDGVARNLTGEILRRIEAKGYSLVDLRMLQADRELLAQHYDEHEGKPFYEPLVEFMESGPIVAIRVAGNRVIEGFRSLAGTTDPTTAAPGTIRGDLARDWGLKVQQNLVHGSDSPESAQRELAPLVPDPPTSASANRCASSGSDEDVVDPVQLDLGEDRDDRVADDRDERHPAVQRARRTRERAAGTGMLPSFRL